MSACAPRVDRLPDRRPDDAPSAPHSAPIAHPPDTAAADTGSNRQNAADTVPERIARRFPSATSLQLRTTPFEHGVVLQGRRVTGYEVDSDRAGTTAEGYGGPVPLRVWLDADARVVEVSVLANDETPGYLKLVIDGGLLERVRGLDAAELESIDAVTMATLSSRAIAEGCRRTAERVAREVVSR